MGSGFTQCFSSPYQLGEGRRGWSILSIGNKGEEEEEERSKSEPGQNNNAIFVS
jgi:hypothetical protein